MNRTCRSGTVLIVILVILVTVSLAAYNFTLTMESEHIAIRNAGDRLVAQQAAFSGAEIFASILEMPRQERLRLSSMLDDRAELWPSQGNPVMGNAFLSDMPSVAFGLGEWQDSQSAMSRLPVTMVDESAKLNLHALIEWEIALPGQARRALLELPEMAESTADRILDWIDADATERGPGYELNARNSLPIYVEEIPWREFVPKDAELSYARPAWMSLLTVSSAERNESFEGRPRIDLNQAELSALHQQLQELVPVSLANYIIALRQYGFSTQSSERLDAASATPDFSVPATMEISSLLDLVDSQVSVPGNSGAQMVASPLDKNIGLDGMMIGQILDQFTVTSDSRLVGRVNLLTAPVEVIAGVPGLDNLLAQQIIAARGGGPERLHHAFDVLAASGIPPTAMERALPWVTVDGDVIRASLVGRSGEGNLEFLYEVMVDASEGTGRWNALPGDCFRNRHALHSPTP